jgi:hypothetical protein
VCVCTHFTQCPCVCIACCLEGCDVCHTDTPRSICVSVEEKVCLSVSLSLYLSVSLCCEAFEGGAGVLCVCACVCVCSVCVCVCVK